MKSITPTILGFATAITLLASPGAEAQAVNRGAVGAPGFAVARPVTPIVRPGPWVGGTGWRGGSGWVASPGWGGRQGWVGAPGWRGGWGWAGRPGWGWGWGGGWGWGWGASGWGWAGAPGWGWAAPGWGWAGAPVVVAQQTFFPPFESTVFIERDAVAVEQAPTLAPPATTQPTSWWYWCASAQGYYPYVEQCPEAWQRVAPRSPPNTQ